MTRTILVLITLALSPLASWAGAGQVSFCPFPGSEDHEAIDYRKGFKTTAQVPKGRWIPAEAKVTASDILYDGRKEITYAILDAEEPYPTRIRSRYKCWDLDNEVVLDKKFKGGKRKDNPLVVGGDIRPTYVLKMNMNMQEVPFASYCQQDIKLQGNPMKPGSFYYQLQYFPNDF